MKNTTLFLLFFIFLLLIGCTKTPTGHVIIERNTEERVTTFVDTGKDICTNNGKPIIRMFSTSWCPHCDWIRSTYMSTVSEYGNQIEAYLWEIDTDDNLLTPEQDSVPQSEKDVFAQYNPEQSIPTFVFGCTYARIGNGYEHENDLQSEVYEFTAVINKLLATQQN